MVDFIQRDFCCGEWRQGLAAAAETRSLKIVPIVNTASKMLDMLSYFQRDIKFFHILFSKMSDMECLFTSLNNKFI